MRRLLFLLILIASIAVAGCGEDEKEPAETTTTEEVAGCQTVDPPEPKGEQSLDKPTLKLDPSKTYVAKVATSCGDFTIELDAKRAPKTGGSFVTLAKAGFFDNTTFHRVAKGFVIQGGDPSGDGTGGPGYSVVEAPPENLQYTRGIVAMAKTGNEAAGTSGSQFFVVTGEDTGLPPDYALLGEVTEGMEAVDTIAVVETVPPEDGNPTQPIVIESITIEES